MVDLPPKAGRFGVVSGVEVLRALDRLDITTRRAVEVVNWTNEEGARFQLSMLCSPGGPSYRNCATMKSMNARTFGDRWRVCG